MRTHFPYRKYSNFILTPSFLNTLDALGKHPSTSQLAKSATDLFDAAHDIFLSMCVFDVYIEERPHLSLDDYQADRDAFLQSLILVYAVPLRFSRTRASLYSANAPSPLLSFRFLD